MVSELSGRGKMGLPGAYVCFALALALGTAVPSTEARHMLDVGQGPELGSGLLLLAPNAGHPRCLCEMAMAAGLFQGLAT